IRVHLTIAGAFLREEEEAEFRARIAADDLTKPALAVTYAGFVSGAEKTKLLRESDCLCFPTYYHAESFGLVVVEAMAFGMAIVVTRWRAIPEILPLEHSGFVPPRNPQETAATLRLMFTHDGAAA